MENINVKFAFDFVERDHDWSTDDLYQCYKNVDDNFWPYILGKYINTPKTQLLPDKPGVKIQHKFHGTTEIKALTQSLYFYQIIKESYKKYGKKPLVDSNLLDFGFGWGRMLRFFYKDMPVSQIFGCDPSDESMSYIEKLHLKGVFKQSEFIPETLPFDESFDLVFSSSVFTHLSEHTHLACLKAIANAMNPGGIAFITVRPPGFKERNKAIIDYLAHYNMESSSPNEDYLFVPNENFIVKGHATYGHAVISKRYIHENWSKYFRVLDAKFQAFDPFQVVLVLEKK